MILWFLAWENISGLLINVLLSCTKAVCRTTYCGALYYSTLLLLLLQYTERSAKNVPAGRFISTCRNTKYFHEGHLEDHQLTMVLLHLRNTKNSSY